MLETLKKTGLSQREAKLYLALLDQGSTTIGPLVEKTDIPSSKIYEVLYRLEDKGLANHIIIKKQKHFQAADPEILLHQLEDKTEKFKKHLQELKTRKTLAQEKQYAEFYEGKEAIFTLLRNLVKQARKGDEYCSFELDDEYKEDDIAAFFSGLALLRSEKGMLTRILAKKETKKILEYELPKKSLKLMHVKYTTTRYPEGIIILNDEVILLEFEGEPSAVRIKSETHAKNYKKFFEELYKEK